MAEPVSAAAVAGLAMGAFGTLQSALFMFTAIKGLGGYNNGKPTHDELGKPWSVWMQAGLDGTQPTGGGAPLSGAAGPFPHVWLL